VSTGNSARTRTRRAATGRWHSSSRARWTGLSAPRRRWARHGVHSASALTATSRAASPGTSAIEICREADGREQELEPAPRSPRRCTGWPGRPGGAGAHHSPPRHWSVWFEVPPAAPGPPSSTASRTSRPRARVLFCAHRLQLADLDRAGLGAGAARGGGECARHVYRHVGANDVAGALSPVIAHGWSSATGLSLLAWSCSRRSACRHWPP